MRHRAFSSFACLLAISCSESRGDELDAGDGGARPAISFRRIALESRFLAEGANLGDFDGDGALDVVAGPYWYQGPEFTARHEIYEPLEFDPHGYSDNFFAFVRDLDGDSDDDVLVIGFPGEAARWYENPTPLDAHWQKHLIFAAVDNESPAFEDLTGDGRPELVFSSAGSLGYAEPTAVPTAAWQFRALSPPGRFVAFTHGLGVGDVSGDGRADVLEATGYWQQPASSEATWSMRASMFGDGGAQMFALDVDGDGDRDVVTTLSAHGYGVGWFEQVGTSDTPQFVLHVISPVAAGAGALHEPHALATADLNGDGLMDLVTGERFWGHVPQGDPDLAAPARLIWLELARDGGSAQFAPHTIDEASGVGTQVVAGDANGDGRIDVLVANKKGVFLFVQEKL